MTFNEFKEEVVGKCKRADACEPEFKKLLHAKTERQLWTVLLSNYTWCKNNNIFNKMPDSFVFDEDFNGNIFLSGCDLTGITLPINVSGFLDLGRCNLKGIVLPKTVGISLYVGGCNLEGVELPVVEKYIYNEKGSYSQK